MKQSVRTRGRTFTGIVVEDRMQKTATVEWQRSRFIPKYERFETLTTKVKAHNPESIDAKKGDIVRIQECRPLSKTKQFMIVEKVGREELFVAKEQLREESRVKQEPKKESSEAEEQHEGS